MPEVGWWWGEWKKCKEKRSLLKAKILIQSTILGDNDCHPFGIHEMIRLISTLFHPLENVDAKGTSKGVVWFPCSTALNITIDPGTSWLSSSDAVTAHVDRAKAHGCLSEHKTCAFPFGEGATLNVRAGKPSQWSNLNFSFYRLRHASIQTPPE